MVLLKERNGVIGNARQRKRMLIHGQASQEIGCSRWCCFLISFPAYRARTDDDNDVSILGSTHQSYGYYHNNNRCWQFNRHRGDSRFMPCVVFRLFSSSPLLNGCVPGLLLRLFWWDSCLVTDDDDDDVNDSDLELHVVLLLLHPPPSRNKEAGLCLLSFSNEQQMLLPLGRSVVRCVRGWWHWERLVLPLRRQQQQQPQEREPIPNEEEASGGRGGGGV